MLNPTDNICSQTRPDSPQIKIIQHAYRQPLAISLYTSSHKYMAWRKTNSLAEDKELAETARIIKGLGNCKPI
jgi:hypothetical protein